MYEITSVRRLFTLLSTCVEDSQPLIDCITEKIKETEEYKAVLQAVKDNHVLQQDIDINLEQKSLTELFDMYTRIKAIQNARKILHRKMLYSNIEELKNIPKPDFNNTNSVNAYIGHLNNLPENRNNITNISAENAFAFYRDDTVTDLSTEASAFHFKIHGDNLDSKIKILEENNIYYCLNRFREEEKIKEEKIKREEKIAKTYKTVTTIISLCLVLFPFFQEFSFVVLIIWGAPVLWFGTYMGYLFKNKGAIFMLQIMMPLCVYISGLVFREINGAIDGLLSLLITYGGGFASFAIGVIMEEKSE